MPFLSSVCAEMVEGRTAERTIKGQGPGWDPPKKRPEKLHLERAVPSGARSHLGAQNQKKLSGGSQRKYSFI